MNDISVKKGGKTMFNRKILFRGKRTDTGEWVEGCYIENEKEQGKAYIGYIWEVINGEIEDFDIAEVLPETVSQYTGQDDINGKHIFERDIVRILDPVRNQPYGEVSFKDGEWLVKISSFCQINLNRLVVNKKIEVVHSFWEYKSSGGE